MWLLLAALALAPGRLGWKDGALIYLPWWVVTGEYLYEKYLKPKTPATADDDVFDPTA